MLLDYEFCRKAVASLRGTDATLEDLFDQTAKAACRVRERIQGSWRSDFADAEHDDPIPPIG